ATIRWAYRGHRRVSYTLRNLVRFSAPDIAQSRGYQGLSCRYYVWKTVPYTGSCFGRAQRARPVYCPRNGYAGCLASQYRNVERPWIAHHQRTTPEAV